MALGITVFVLSVLHASKAAMPRIGIVEANEGLFDRVRRARPLLRTTLDSTMLGKSGHAAIYQKALPHLAMHPQGRYCCHPTRPQLALMPEAPLRRVHVAAERSRFDPPPLLSSGLAFDRRSYFEKHFLREYTSGMVDPMDVVRIIATAAKSHFATIFGLSSNAPRADFMNDLGVTFFLVRLTIDVKTELRSGQIEVETFATFSKVSFKRDYVLREVASGTVIAVATASYVMVDVKSRKLAKPQKDKIAILESFLVNAGQRVLEHPPKKAQMSEFSAGDAERKFLVIIGSQDIDDNGHVEGTVYIDWVLETLKYTSLRDLAYLDVEYKHECFKDEEILSLAKQTNERQGVVTFDHILQKDDGSVFLKAQSRWRSHSPVDDQTPHDSASDTLANPSPSAYLVVRGKTESSQPSAEAINKQRAEVLWVVSCNNTAPGDSVVIVGSTEELGEWDIAKGLWLSSGAMFPEWHIRSKLPISTTKVSEYKIVVVNADGHPVEWEPGNNRKLVLPENPRPGHAWVVQVKFGEAARQARTDSEFSWPSKVLLRLLSSVS
eukprot:gnl/TRDRNA2_/TRDRNA2_179647_c0_seq1.p1 gnl/TRDRNA2_/TRDRNA2_179647_c0~~gnl/TRDRNA2_/TRDRNA2_179647_c0_seq1.p1  ORF type:complete len:551 (+),score=64.95 gnl/TRDRNA2_/TRDRNA2_179647_c0_seq1:50-1702(+)